MNSSDAYEASVDDALIKSSNFITFISYPLGNTEHITCIFARPRY